MKQAGVIRLLGSVRCVCRVRFNEVSYQSLTGVCSIDPLLLHLQTKFLAAAFGQAARLDSKKLVLRCLLWILLPLPFSAAPAAAAVSTASTLWTILNAHSANVSLLLYSSRQGPA